MNIAFLHQPNDPYAEVRIKYFIQQSHNVYSFVFHKENQQKEIDGLKIIQLPKHKAFYSITKRFIYRNVIRKYTSLYNIDVFYVINALNCYYLKASKAKLNFLELQGSDVIRSPHKFPFLKKFYKIYFKYADGITQDSIIAKENGLKYIKKDIANEIIEIGIDFSIFNDKIENNHIRKKLNLGTRPIVLHTRSLNPIYQIDTIIKSIPIIREEFNDICFLFAGSFESLDTKTKDYINQNGLSSNIHFCGWIDHDSEMKFYYQDSDVVVSVPSTDSSPFSVYEAMATKTPVVASGLPWLKGKFTPNKHLYTVPVADNKALAEAVIGILQKTIVLDLESAYNIVYKRINMLSENKKLENLLMMYLN